MSDIEGGSLPRWIFENEECGFSKGMVGCPKLEKSLHVPVQ